MTVTSIDSIKRDAEDAAERGRPREAACPWPAASIEGIQWKLYYEAADGPYRHALAAYSAAIGADAA